MGAAAKGPITVAEPQAAPALEGLETFVDRLMHAEPAGRDDAANSRSTARGPIQFINSTLLAIARHHFAEEVAGFSDDETLATRTNRPFARRAAAAYSRDIFAYLASRGLHPDFGALRLAFLVGAGTAAQLLEARANAPLASALRAAAIRANPFTAGMRVADLLVRAAPNVGEGVQPLAGAAPTGALALPGRGEGLAKADCTRAACRSRAARSRLSRAAVHPPPKTERQKA
jgi:hypothetical protein